MRPSLSLGIALTLAGCSTVAVQPEGETPPIPVHVTPFPYNSDVDGNDLPFEIGRFEVPDVYDGSSDAEVVVGYVRYPAAEGAEGPPIVFLTRRDSPGRSRQALYAALRNFGDVIVFNRRGYGFSSPPPPCPERLNYPFDEPLALEELTARTRSLVASCVAFLRDAGFTPAAYDSRQVVEDLSSLGKALQSDRLILIAENALTSVAVAALTRSSQRYAKVVLVNPRLHERLPDGSVLGFFERLDRLERGDFSFSRSITSLQDRLRYEPQLVGVRTRSGQDIAISVGELDLAFVCARALSADTEYLHRLEDALRSASDGNFRRLGELVFHVRQRISQPEPTSILRAVTAADPLEPTRRISVFDYALRWPASDAQPGDRGHSRVELPFITSPVLIVQGAAALTSQFEAGRVFGSYRRVDASAGGTDLLDDEAIRQIILDFLGS